MYLLENGSDVNAVGCYGRLPIHSACLLGFAGVLQVLLDQGSLLSISDRDKTKPLFLAAHHGNEVCVAMMLAAGADVNALSEYGWKTLDRACGRGDIAVVDMLLKGGANPDFLDDTGNTPLLEAVSGGPSRSDIVHLLLAAGADFSTRNSSGQTAESRSDGLCRLILKSVREKSVLSSRMGSSLDSTTAIAGKRKRTM